MLFEQAEGVIQIPEACIQITWREGDYLMVSNIQCFVK